MEQKLEAENDPRHKNSLLTTAFSHLKVCDEFTGSVLCQLRVLHGRGKEAEEELQNLREGFLILPAQHQVLEWTRQVSGRPKIGAETGARNQIDQQDRCGIANLRKQRIEIENESQSSATFALLSSYLGVSVGQ